MQIFSEMSDVDLTGSYIYVYKVCDQTTLPFWHVTTSAPRPQIEDLHIVHSHAAGTLGGTVPGECARW